MIFLAISAKRRFALLWGLTDWKVSDSFFFCPATGRPFREVPSERQLFFQRVRRFFPFRSFLPFRFRAEVPEDTFRQRAGILRSLLKASSFRNSVTGIRENPGLPVRFADGKT